MFKFILKLAVFLTILAGVILSILTASIGDYLGAYLLLFMPVIGIVILYLETNYDK